MIDDKDERIADLETQLSSMVSARDLIIRDQREEIAKLQAVRDGLYRDILAAVRPLCAETHTPAQSGEKIVEFLRDACSDGAQSIRSLTHQRDQYRQRKDNAYTERNCVVALLSRMALAMGWRAGIGTHEVKPGEDWEPEWMSIVCIDLPTGQASWHIHDSHVALFDGLPRYDGRWDGHDTPEKYRRVSAVRGSLLTMLPEPDRG